MKRRTLFAAIWFPVIFHVVVAISNAQTAQPVASPQPTPINVEIMYTGKLLGYFRVPSLQKNENFKGCYQTSDSDSRAAREFLAMRRGRTATLVGTGDNFSPQLEARIFSDLPNQGPNYAVGNKEQYFGDGTGWIFYDRLSESQRKHIRDGFGTIPTDNVGCFLRAANFTAIVPGKHDFYFGPERVRQFARLLAAPEAGESRPVQMLGANLVIKTESIESNAGSAKIPDDADFREWPKTLSVQNLKDGKLVYPWFSYVKIKLIELQKTENDENLKNQEFLSNLNQHFSNTGTADLTSFADFVKRHALPADPHAKKELEQLQTSTLQLTSTRLCRSPRSPNDIALGCRNLEGRVSWIGGTFTLSLTLPEEYRGQDGHFSTLEYGQNYGLCVDVPKDKEFPNADRGCMRFAVHTPFFYFPHRVPGEANHGYTDPNPYVVNGNVAIFGVVDPNLGGQVGILNFAWQNEQRNLNSPLSAEDPFEALTQLLDYFDRRHPAGFKGVKVLLAQTTPQRARALAAKFPEFQIVVSGADLDQGTSESEMSTVWKPNKRTSSFLAVPNPYADDPTREGTVHFGMVNARQEPNELSWNLTSANLPNVEVKDYRDPATAFWDKLKSLPKCLPKGYKVPEEKIENQTLLKWAVLCSMREHMGADIALIQSRDLYDKIPDPDPKRSESQLLNRTDPNDPGNLQQTLDRLIWKGDLVTLLYVPGADLRKALKQSSAYAAEEKSTFALAVEKGRQLETLGVREEGGEYFVNDLPLDDNKKYAVATTDYIGAGDTGYPDLVKAALNPKTRPAAFAGELVSISSLVCRNLSTEPDRFCLGPIKGKEYLDETSAAQIPPHKPASWLSRMWDATGFKWPGPTKNATDTAGVIEQKVQRRGFWAFSLKNFSLGFKDLNNNRTDANIKEKFGGVSTPGVNAKENRTITLGVDSRFSYFAHKREFFVGTGIDFESQRTGSTGKDETAFLVSQARNKLFGDIGLVFWRRPGRAVPNLGAVVSVRAETQLQQPFYIFTLGTPNGDPKRIDQGRGLLLLGRLGMRWQNKANSLEVGGQFGREMKALRGYRFENQGVVVECLVSSSKPLSKCIEENSTPPGGVITVDSNATALLQGRPRAGIYWNHAFTIPFSAKVKYEVTQDADFFFVNFSRDTSIDTRFRYQSKNKLSFMIWKNFSIGPTLDLLLYQNKVNRSFLFQRQFGLETKFNFDIFNRREKGAQIKQKP